MTITIDIETRSEADLKKVGAWAYSEHPSTDIICVCWGVDNKPIREWVPGQPCDDLFVAMERHAIEAHNVAFERSMWVNVLAKKYGWPIPEDDQWRDTMAVACYYGLPAALDALARALHFQGKDPEGQRLITKYSKLHLKTAKREIPPEDLRKFIEYCKQDVRIEQSISDYLGDLPPREMPVFLHHQEVSMRGIYLDCKGIANAAAMVEERAEELEAKFVKSVGCGPRQNAKLKEWFKSQGWDFDNLQAETLQDALDSEERPPRGKVREAIEIRLAINKASTRKLDAMARNAGKDGRARFQTRYHGAAPGRSTGAGFQPLNLVRGYEDGIKPDALVRDIGYGDLKYLDCVYGDATKAISMASRHWIMAQPGNKIMAGDFSSIEAVVLACLAGEQWKVEAFQRKEPIYERTADKIYDLPTGTVTKATHPNERQDGKRCELAFGYQGALGAWLKFDPKPIHSDEKIIGFCKKWRIEHPATVQFWRDLERCALEAVRHPGDIWYANQIGFETVDEWLSMILPNEKRIWYYAPQIRMAMPRWHEPLVNDDCAAGACDCKLKPQLTYMAQKEGQWKRVSTYGGKLAENATQATSREILKCAEMKVVAAGYHQIFDVYDEIVCEEKIGFGSVEELEAVMVETPGAWAVGWPISAEVWEGERYKK